MTSPGRGVLPRYALGESGISKGRDARRHLRTVRQWIASGQIPGELIGQRQVYIDDLAWRMRRQTALPAKASNSRQPLQLKLTGDSRIDSILLSS